MNEANVIELAALFEDGKMQISRKDGKPISLITHEELEGDCIEVLEYGCKGNAVKALQALLNCHGQHLDVDGIFGSLTQTALIIFQDQKQLPATGTASNLEWTALIGR